MTNLVNEPNLSLSDSTGGDTGVKTWITNLVPNSYVVV